MSEDRSRVVVRLPNIGEAITEAVIVRFLHRPGTVVARDQPIAELELDKCCIDLVAPEAGVIETLLVEHGTTIPIGAELYVLRRLDAGVVLADDVATVRCELEHLLARARGLGAPREAEAALFLTAIVRALAAVPGLRPRGPAVTTLWVDVDEAGERRVHAEIPIDIEVAAALQLLGAGTPDAQPQLQVLRLHGLAAPTGRAGDATALRVVIGAVAHEPVARAGAVVVRPMTTILVERDGGGEALRDFAAVLAEQLAQV